MQQSSRQHASPSRLTKAPDKTRAALLLAAKILFARKGYDGTSVKELAKAAQVNISLVSYHFDGKEGLYRACLDQFGRERLAVAERLLLPAGSREEFRVRLQMFVEEVIHCHVQEPELAKMIHRECEMELPRFQDIFRETFLKVFERMFVYLQAAQRAGYLRKEADPQTAAALLFGSIFHMTRVDSVSKKYFNLSIQNPKYRAKVIDHILHMFLDGFGK